MNKCLVLFVEGYTEIEFYKQILICARKKLKTTVFNCYIEYINTKGVGGFKNIALRKFIKEIKPKYDKQCNFCAAFCRDTDVFEMTSNPPVDWHKVEAAFKENGVKQIIHIKAKSSIEDWFLMDKEGICNYLHLPKKTKSAGSNGYDKLKKLFKQANKLYYKGIKCNELIKHLNIEKIETEIRPQLEPIYKFLGIK